MLLKHCSLQKWVLLHSVLFSRHLHVLATRMWGRERGAPYSTCCFTIPYDSCQQSFETTTQCTLIKSVEQTNGPTITKLTDETWPRVSLTTRCLQSFSHYITNNHSKSTLLLSVESSHGFIFYFQFCCLLTSSFCATETTETRLLRSVEF